MEKPIRIVTEDEIYYLKNCMDCGREMKVSTVGKLRCFECRAKHVRKFKSVELKRLIQENVDLKSSFIKMSNTTINSKELFDFLDFLYTLPHYKNEIVSQFIDDITHKFGE